MSDMTFAELQALKDAIADKVGDYLLDCRLNYWEPDADHIVVIGLEAAADHFDSEATT